MKIAINHIGGLFDYIVEGVLENKAAIELEQKLEFLSRSHLIGSGLLTEIEDARRSVEENYGVTVRTTI